MERLEIPPGALCAAPRAVIMRGMARAFYRAYRPKTLGDLMGQDVIAEIIRNAARTQKIGHAYLFYGPRGTGKTTTARLLAKLVNCEKRRDNEKFREKGEPCNECRPCREIDENRALDVTEIDAASNRGIDEIRALKEGAKLSPTSYTYKVFIIDEAHQLTKEAANALLKTLEEPPSHVVFVLATTEYEKLPATIVSRTQRFNFKRPTTETIFKKLSLIAKEEKIDIPKEALHLIARAAEGSFRDAESLFEQVVSFGATSSTADVEHALGRVGHERVSALAGHLLEGDLSASLAYLEHAHESGLNIVQLTKDLIHYLRRAIALGYDPTLEEIFRGEMTPEEIASLKAHSVLARRDPKVTELLKSLIRAYSEMRYSPFILAPVQIAIIENLRTEK